MQNAKFAMEVIRLNIRLNMIACNWVELLEYKENEFT